MLPAEDETILNPKKINNEVDEAESASSSNTQKNSIDDDGAHCYNGVRVRVVAEINENCKTLDVVAEVNEKVSHKREASWALSTVTKRCKSSDENNENGVTETNQESQPSENDDSIMNFQKEKLDTPCNSDSVCTQNREETNLVLKIKSERLTDNEDSNVNDVRPSGSGTSNPVDIKPAIKVEKADASSTSRDSCRFGIRCYRRNPMHRKEEAHPGDDDYRRPNYPPPPKGTPECPYGNLCYRRNPVHFEQFNHPPETDFEQNYKNYRLRLRQRRQQEHAGDDVNNTANSSELDDDYDLDDPFINDEEFDSDYVPNSNEEDDEDDYDACDRAEE
ncbi:aprataxin and PNK-like factor [Anastrepha ludens]|uniref:aprataxin and PNK-like factor n=1 Tax=Anastrepha ludens TaxID=28586 RepID=UPI0023AF6261|nr:aprataxin and PNK-like factor [Anastrepha ludens]